MSVNKAILVGRLGRDPETRYTSGGQAVCNFSLATDESYKDRAGERQKRTEWHKIVMWAKLGELAQQYLKKGSLVYIEGRIQSREWQDKEGQKRTTVEIVGSEMKFLGGRGDNAPPRAASALPHPHTPKRKRRSSREAAPIPDTRPGDARGLSVWKR